MIGEAYNPFEFLYSTSISEEARKMELIMEEVVKMRIVDVVKKIMLTPEYMALQDDDKAMVEALSNEDDENNLVVIGKLKLHLDNKIIPKADGSRARRNPILFALHKAKKDKDKVA